MKIMKHSVWTLAALALFLGSSFSAFANSSECASIDLQKGDSGLISATIQEISALTGIDGDTLEWATATDPLFTVIVDDQAIPYHEFGPETDTELITESGLVIRPDFQSLEIEMQDGTVSRLDLPSLVEQKNRSFAQEASDPGEAGTEGWWFLIPPAVGVGSAAACWTAAQVCAADCTNFINSCPCGGECSCGECGFAPSRVCYTCPLNPPGDSVIWMP